MNRLSKMSPFEVAKRIAEHAQIYWSRIKYRHAVKWPYERFAQKGNVLTLSGVPPIQENATCNWKHYAIYASHVDLTQPINWFCSDIPGNHWPASHYATIDYRPGNPYGDVRVNWELNRLQFLPLMVDKDEDLARKILIDWLDKNHFSHGPAYIASMEVALRWISIYRAICLFKKPLETSLRLPN
jgi:hypothetical protein